MCSYAVGVGTSENENEKKRDRSASWSGSDSDNENDANTDEGTNDPKHATNNANINNNNNASPSRPPNPMTNAPFWSRVIFRWPYPLLKLGMERPLVDSDIPEIALVDSSRRNREYLLDLWEKEVQRCISKKERTGKACKPSLHRAILTDFFRSMWHIQPIMGCACTAKIVQAVYLGTLIESFEKRGASGGYSFAAVIVACGFVVLFEHHHVFFITWRKGMQLRLSCVGAIYGKCLKLSSTHQETSASSGKIMNLASNDVERFLLAALFISHLIWSPLQSIAILAVGWTKMGPAFAVGFCLLIFGFIPFQFYLSHRFALLRSTIAGITDQRINFVSQAVQGARVMKMSGYEHRFLDRITEGRRREISQISRANRLKALNEAMFFACNVVVSLVIFLFHVGIFGGTLTPGNVYMVFTLVNILQLELTKHVSLGIMGVSEVYVSIERIQKFLEFPETSSCEHNPLLGDGDSDSAVQIHDNNSESESGNVVVSMSNMDCYWNHVQPADSTLSLLEDGEGNEIVEISATKANGSTHTVEHDESVGYGLTPALSDITLDLERGQLTCVIGTVGSGKSALLQAVVGELKAYEGTISYHTTNKPIEYHEEGSRKQQQRISYAAQDPWIMDGTVRENITMGLPFRSDWYDRVVDACGLRMDFGIFRDGDSTIVGDRGVQCSGGQRARIGLARAIYRDAEVLVADDPLSAVDAKVGKQMFHEALLGLCVNRGNCVLLATHQHQYVHDHRCVLLTSGRIRCVGSYAECLEAAGGTLTTLEAADDASEEERSKGIPKENISGARVERESSESEESKAKTTEVEDEDNTVKDSKEGMNSGVVQWETYKNYIHAMGGWPVAFSLLITFCVTQGVALWTIITMGKWSELPPQDQKSWNMLGLILGQVSMAIVLATFRAFFSFAMTIKASKNLHDDMATAMLRAKIAFFDTNPMGRVLNRFSADVGSNDDLLPQTLFDFSVIFFIVIGAVFTTMITLPFVLLVMPPLLYYFVVVRGVFVTSSRELKRLEGVARSPIFAMMNESLSGIATIRSNNATTYFTKKFEAMHDSHTRAFFSFIASSRWVGFRMDSLALLLMSFVCFLSVFFQRQGWFTVDPAIVGLSISMLLQLCSAFQWCIRQSAEIVNQMVCVERVLGYGKVEPEAPLELEIDNKLDRSWPSEGAITVKDLSVRYRPSLPLALNGVSFSVPSGSRVGVVGRTGSGKSTIVQTLFRLLEAESGQINIDNVDVAEIGLHRLRTSISVIPQHPTLFSGCTVRENLDVFGLHSEEAIHEALESAHLSEVIADLPKGIDSVVNEGGSNFSVGQRQLLCLARAILSKNKILVLDEATASVDRRTDQMLHESLHESFGDATIIAVAHRLDTVIDHDYILVLGQGKVLEFGSPADLLRKSGGAFSTMVDDTGEVTANELRQRAFSRKKRE